MDKIDKAYMKSYVQKKGTLKELFPKLPSNKEMLEELIEEIQEIQDKYKFPKK